MQIKICGLQNTEDAKIVNEAGVSYAGIIQHYEKSHRNVDTDTAKRIIAALSPDIKKVGVTVSPTLEAIRDIEAAGFDIIQIHGKLPFEYIDMINIPIWRAFNVDNNSLSAEYLKYKKIEAFLFDAKLPGSGKTFDWELLKALPRDEMKEKNVAFILAGGISSENVEEAVKKTSPDIIDVSSAVERADKKGKDAEKVREFCKIIVNLPEIC
ncbi:MAG: phosphoribosylanthranilate isomerase [Lachnospiraceae bacterium]|nr:phosphoribosylanthranilate isomerase [Lachnospiraceae bacterium]